MIEGLEPARGPDGRLTALRAEGQLRADEKDLRLESEQRTRVVGDKRSNLRHLRGPLENVALVDDDDNLLAPPADVLHEAPLGFGKRAIGRRDEEHQIGTRDELGGHRLVLANDGVGPRRVDDADFAEQIDRRFDDEEVGLPHCLFRLVAMLQHGDDGRCGGHPFCQQRLPDERVDERALAGIELSDDDKQEQLVELPDGLVERLLLVVSGVDARQRRAQPHEQGTLFAEQGVLFVGKHTCQHASLRCTNQTKRQSIRPHHASLSISAEVSAAVWMARRISGVNPGCRPDALAPYSTHLLPIAKHTLRRAWNGTSFEPARGPQITVSPNPLTSRFTIARTCRSRRAAS